MDKELKLIYIASPYSHKDKAIENYRYKEITRIAAKLHKRYDHAFILPITQSYQVNTWEPSLGGSFSKWRDRDLLFISKSDEVWVVMLEGWQESIGVKAEIAFATENLIPIQFIDAETLRFKPSKAINNETVPNNNTKLTKSVTYFIDDVAR